MSLYDRVLTEGWSKFKPFFPGISAPLFHKTSGPNAANIALRGQGIKGGGDSTFGSDSAQRGLSFTRNLDWAMSPHIRGNYIFVVDGADLKKRGKIVPFQHPSASDEFEERFYGDVPAKMIRGLLLLYSPSRAERRELSGLPFPVVSAQSMEML